MLNTKLYGRVDMHRDIRSREPSKDYQRETLLMVLFKALPCGAVSKTVTVFRGEDEEGKEEEEEVSDERGVGRKEGVSREDARCVEVSLAALKLVEVSLVSKMGRTVGKLARKLDSNCVELEPSDLDSTETFLVADFFCSKSSEISFRGISSRGGSSGHGPE